jgi:hypothetical protein
MSDRSNIVALSMRVNETHARRLFADTRQDERFMRPPFRRATIWRITASGDSFHTYRIERHLRRGSIISTHDIQVREGFHPVMDLSAPVLDSRPF